VRNGPKDVNFRIWSPEHAVNVCSGETIKHAARMSIVTCRILATKCLFRFRGRSSSDVIQGIWPQKEIVSDSYVYIKI